VRVLEASDKMQLKLKSRAANGKVFWQMENLLFNYQSETENGVVRVLQSDGFWALDFVAGVWRRPTF